MTLFSDGFESGNLSEWTGTQVHDSSTVTVETNNPHHGTYNLKADISAGSPSYAEVNKTLTSAVSTIYCGAYVKFATALPNSTRRYVPIILYSSGFAGYPALAAIRESGGVTYWTLEINNNGTREQTVSALPVSLDTWYWVELYWKKGVSDGAATLFVNGNSVASVTGKNTNTDGDVAIVGFGDDDSNGPAHQVCIDCVSVSNTYIGLEYVTATAPLQLSGSNLSIPQANGSTDGYLSASNWNTFNNKYGSGASPTFAGLTTTGTVIIGGIASVNDYVTTEGYVTASGGTSNGPGYRFSTYGSTESFGGQTGVGLNSAGQIVLNAGYGGVVTAVAGTLKNTLDDGSGNTTIAGSLTLPCACPYFTWEDLEPYLWGLEWDGNEWDWNADIHTLPLAGSFARFNDNAGTNRYLDIGIFRTEKAPNDCTLWVSQHLIVKKDFACGGAGTLFQGALVLGSDWDAHDVNAQMPQIMLLHSEGNPYPENPKRDILQIWRSGHAGFARLQCGSIYVQMDYPTLDLKAADGQLKITLKHDGSNGLLYTSTGDLVLAGFSTHVRPYSNNTFYLGDSNFRWKEIWAVTTNFGDAVFANGWRLTEDSNSGVLLLRSDGSIAQKWN